MTGQEPDRDETGDPTGIVIVEAGTECFDPKRGHRRVYLDNVVACHDCSYVAARALTDNIPAEVAVATFRQWEADPTPREGGS